MFSARAELQQDDAVSREGKKNSKITILVPIYFSFVVKLSANNKNSGTP
jgi:hypothetical protein